MPARKPEQSVRSGRFSMPNTVASIVIAKIETVGATSYRIHNSGQNTFTVDATDIGSVQLLERCSIDVPVGAASVPATLTVAKVANKAYEGVFDILLGDGAARSGRFQSEAAATVTIVQHSSGLYRVYNTGELDITLAGGHAATIAKNCSLDFTISAPLTVAGAGEFQGVYEALGAGVEPRSGHFKHTVAGDAAAPPMPVTLKLIDVTGTTEVHRYRITNAGRRPNQSFKIKTSQDGTTWTDLVAGASLLPDQSLDFQVSAGINRMIGAEGTIGKTISGIVDYLGK